MDSLATGGSGDVVRKLRGKDVNDTFATNGTLAQILSKGSLNLKVIVTSGLENAQKVDKLGNAVLGLFGIQYMISLKLMPMEMLSTSCMTYK